MKTTICMSSALSLMDATPLFTTLFGQNMGYTQEQKPHQRSNLVSAIALFAGVNGDSELEAQCELELQRIRGEALPKKS